MRGKFFSASNGRYAYNIQSHMPLKPNVIRTSDRDLKDLYLL